MLLLLMLRNHCANGRSSKSPWSLCEASQTYFLSEWVSVSLCTSWFWMLPPWVVTRTCSAFKTTPVLQELHWLPTTYCMHFKLLLLTFKVTNNLAPASLSELICINTPSWVLKSSSSMRLTVPFTFIFSHLSTIRRGFSVVIKSQIRTSDMQYR